MPGARLRASGTGAPEVREGRLSGQSGPVLHVRPLTLRQANELVARWHRHHRPVQGHRFSIGVYDDSGTCHGAAIVGRPVAHNTEQYQVAEVTRLVTDGTYNACSTLYAAAARAAKAMGFMSIQTFILDSETGASLKASGWVLDGYSRGGAWDRPSRGRNTPDEVQPPKQRWVKALNPVREMAA
jgi:hypothetical protein